MAEGADGFWAALDLLVAESRVVIDRPRGSAHPRYPGFVYPLDYGYLEGTRAADGGGIDVWAGSLPDRTVTGVICCVDGLKRDAEIKILLGCTPEETRVATAAHNSDGQAGMLVERKTSSG